MYHLRMPETAEEIGRLRPWWMSKGPSRWLKNADNETDIRFIPVYPGRVVRKDGHAGSVTLGVPLRLKEGAKRVVTVRWKMP
ncbi:MAG: hypothetical protein ACR5K7_01395 [Symbiopectobacterium sp.]